MKQSQFEAIDTLSPLPESVTMCATIDESGNEHVITELMIRRAIEQTEAEQLWPVPKTTNSLVAERSNRGPAQILAFQA